MADKKFIKHKNSLTKSVTLVRRDGPYDEGANAKYSDDLNEKFRGISGDAKAHTIKEFKNKKDMAAETMRETTKKARSKNDASFKFFKHETSTNKSK